LNQGRLAFGLRAASSSSASLFVPGSGPDLRDGRNHHVAVTLQRSSTGGGHLFVDGQPVLMFDPTSQNGDLTTSGWMVGNLFNNGSYTPDWLPFYGFIDELAVYGRALTPNEIFALWRAGKAGKSPPAPLLLNPTLVPGGVGLAFRALPGRTYRLQGTQNLSEGWADLATVVVNSGGSGNFIDTNALPVSAFYRLIHP
jgi:hypothetical protein